MLVFSRSQFQLVQYHTCIALDVCYLRVNCIIQSAVLFLYFPSKYVTEISKWLVNLFVLYMMQNAIEIVHRYVVDQDNHIQIVHI